MNTEVQLLRTRADARQTWLVSCRSSTGRQGGSVSVVSTTPAVIGGRPCLSKQREIKEDVQGQFTQGVQEHTYSNPHTVYTYIHTGKQFQNWIIFNPFCFYFWRQESCCCPDWPEAPSPLDCLQNAGITGMCLHTLLEINNSFKMPLSFKPCFRQ